jgi:hypothetical protein
MSETIERNGVYVMGFSTGKGVDRKFWEHQIFPQERDQVELIDEKGETILEFTNNLIVKDKDGVVGNIHMEQQTAEHSQWVYYENPLRTRVTFPKEMSLLLIEREISKRYIAAKGLQ